jgi:GNAT superfamily N-acetyltransferase
MIRPATLIDVPAMLALGEAMHDESPRFAALPWNGAKVRAMIEHLIARPEGLALVAEHDGALVGGFLGFAAPHFASDALVSCDLALYVAQDRRGGIAAARLLRGYVAWAQARGVALIQLGVTTGVNVEATSRLFASVGFVPAGNLFEFKG